MTTFSDLTTALATKYPFAALPLPDGSGWEIVFPDIPGVVGFAGTWEVIGEEAKSILTEWLTIENNDGHPLPTPSNSWNPVERWSGAFAMPRLYSTEEAAGALGVSRRRVVALAKSRDVGQMIGNSLAFTETDIDAMRDRSPGRPPRLPASRRQAS